MIKKNTIVISLVLFLFSAISVKAQDWYFFQENNQTGLYTKEQFTALAERRFDQVMVLNDHAVLALEKKNVHVFQSGKKEIVYSNASIEEDKHGNVYLISADAQRSLLFHNKQLHSEKPFFAGEWEYTGTADFFIVHIAGRCALFRANQYQLQCPVEYDSIVKNELGFFLFKGKNAQLVNQSGTSVSLLYNQVLVTPEYFCYTENGKRFYKNSNSSISSEYDPARVKGIVGNLLFTRSGTLVNSSGKLIMGYINGAGWISHNACYFLQGEQYGLMQADGKILIPARYSTMQSLGGTDRCVAFKSGAGNWEVFSANGKKVGTCSSISAKGELKLLQFENGTKELISKSGKVLAQGAIVDFQHPFDFMDETLITKNRLIVSYADSVKILDLDLEKEIIHGPFQFLFFVDGVYGFTDQKQVHVYTENGEKFMPKQSLEVVSYFGEGVFLLGNTLEVFIMNRKGLSLCNKTFSEAFALYHGEFVGRKDRRYFLYDKSGKELASADSAIMMDRAAVALKTGNENWRVYVTKYHDFLKSDFQEILSYRIGANFFDPVQFYGLSQKDTTWFYSDGEGEFFYYPGGVNEGLNYFIAGSTIENARLVPVVYSEKAGRIFKTAMIPVYDRNDVAKVEWKAITAPKFNPGKLNIWISDRPVFTQGVDEVKVNMRTYFANDPNAFYFDHYVSFTETDPFSFGQSSDSMVIVPSPLLFSRNGKWGAAHWNGSEFIPAEYDFISEFRMNDEWCWVAKKKNELFVFDSDGVLLMKDQVDFAMPVYDVNTMQVIAFLLNRGGKEIISSSSGTGTTKKIKGGKFSILKGNSNSFPATYSGEIEFNLDDQHVIFNSRTSDWSGVLRIHPTAKIIYRDGKKEKTELY
ncbi:MAG: WG repeat-containing protein [Flavobacteriales bacterium]|nr:WG repeat-containing protein [Flavobacteriales bacterium]